MRASIRKNKTMAAKAALESNNKKQRLSVSVRIQSRSKRMADLMKITSTMLKQVSEFLISYIQVLIVKCSFTWFFDLRLVKINIVGHL